MRKRIISILLAGVMLLSLLPFMPGAFAANTPVTTSGQCGSNMKWDFGLTTGKLTITGVGQMDDYLRTTSGYKLQPWSEVSDKVTAITVSDGAYSIGDYAFAYLPNLTRIDLPVSLRALGTNCIHDVPKLKDVYYGGSADDWAKLLGSTSYPALEAATIHYNQNISGGGSDKPDDPGTKPVDPEPDKPVVTKSKITGAQVKDFKFEFTFDTNAKVDNPTIDFTVAHPFEVYKKSDNKLVFKGSKEADGIYSFNTTTRTLHIDLSGQKSLFEDGTAYYVLMSEGFIKFSSKVVSQEVVKGNIEFTTKATTILSQSTGFTTTATVDIATNVLGRPVTSESLSWADSWFERSSNNYSQDIATAALMLSGAASAGSRNAKEPSDNAIVEALIDLGFAAQDIETKNYDSTYYANLAKTTEPDAVGYTLAVKQIRTGLDPTNLVAVVVRGAGENNEQYLAYDLLGGSSGEHYGFTTAANSLYKDLTAFMTNRGLDWGTTKFLVTGYDYGGSVANLTAYNLNSKARSSNVFAYTFAAPAVSRSAGRTGYYSNSNIFNLVSVEDFLGRFPLTEWGYGLWGNTLVLPNSISEGHSTYDSMATRHDSYFRSLTGETYRHYTGTATVNALTAMVEDLLPDYSRYDRTTFYVGASGSKDVTLHDFFNAVAAVRASGYATSLSGYYDELEELTDYLSEGWDGDQLIHAHSLANYWAWLNANSASQLWGSSSVYGGSSYRFKTYLVEGAADVSIYDRYNKVVASVVNGNVRSSTIDIYGTDEEIWVDLPDSGSYAIEIKPTESGSISCEVRECTMQGNTIVVNRTIKLSDIRVSKGETLNCNIPDGHSSSTSSYQLTRPGSDPVTPDYDTSGSTYDYYVITFDDYGTRKTDRWGQLDSIPKPSKKGYTFDGWYTKDGDKVTTRTVFEKDTTVYAQWVDDDGYIVSDIPESSGTGAGYYKVSVPSSVTGGSISASVNEAKEGQRVTLTVKEYTDYELEDIEVYDKHDKEVKLTAQSGNRWYFTMPKSKVTVKVNFAKVGSSTIVVPPGTSFWDTPDSAWYQSAISYVTRNGLMSGVGNGGFAPELPLSRAMLAQILYNREGRPAVEGKSPYTDVADDAWYANAVIWASNRGLVSGYGYGKFGPNDTVTREQFATVLFHYAGNPPFAGEQLVYLDAYKINDWAKLGMEWAVSRGIMSGISVDLMAPQGATSRAQAAQMLMNYFTR